ncbi:MAG: hypothetical protein QOH46_525 [Solirubrobacteraceae bacterium]|nr:hypothetical protein [Solirubrobacteraceae bacterium]
MIGAGAPEDYSRVMAYVTAEARQQLLDAIAEAIDEIGVALAALGEAYEQLDERTGDQLEEQLFRPVQGAYGRAGRTHSGFADRHGLATRTFEAATPRAPSNGVKGFIDIAMQSVAKADHALATLQDSMMPVEVGDAELRAGLSEVRRQLADLPGRARQLVRIFGR